MTGASTGDDRGGGRRWVRVAGRLVAVAAVALCAWALVQQWDEVGPALRSADLRLVAVALVLAAAASLVLALTWWRTLAAFGVRRRFADVAAWYFGGEIGKYLPGGVWSVLGRGELSHRDGVDRRTSWAATVVGLGATVVGGAWCCAVLGPAAAATGGPGWAAWLALGLPVGLVLLHPRVVGAGLRALHVVVRGERLGAPPWGRMVVVALVSLGSWLLVALSAVVVTDALGYDRSAPAVGLASVAAWTVGLLAVPVPAGAGVRELVFAALSGLGAGAGVAVAALSRLLYVAVDALGALAAFAYLRARGPAAAPHTTGGRTTGAPAHAPTDAPTDEGAP